MTKSGIKTVRCIFLSIGFSCVLTAQDKLDSLQAVLKTQATDTSKESTLLQLYESLKFEEQGKAREYLEESLNLSAT